jgi:hypothetical protein
LNSFVTEQVQDCGGHVRIFTPGELVTSLDDGYIGAEPSKGLRQFQSDIPAADDDEVPRHAVEFERFDMRHRSSIDQSRDIGNGRARADAEDHALAGKCARASILERDGDGLWRDEPRLAVARETAAEPSAHPKDGRHFSEGADAIFMALRVHLERAAGRVDEATLLAERFISTSGARGWLTATAS